MGTKKISEYGTVTALNSKDTVPVVLESGEVKRIEKGDLVNDLADVMRIATKDKRGLLSNALYFAIMGLVSDYTSTQMNEPLTTETMKFTFFKTGYIASFTPTANYAFGFSFRISGSALEKQYIFDFAGKIYHRSHDGTKWGSMTLIA